MHFVASNSTIAIPHFLYTSLLIIIIATYTNETDTVVHPLSMQPPQLTPSHYTIPMTSFLGTDITLASYEAPFSAEYRGKTVKIQLGGDDIIDHLNILNRSSSLHVFVLQIKLTAYSKLRSTVTTPWPAKKSTAIFRLLQT